MWNDLPFWGMVVIYFCLSFVMQRVINRLPLVCGFLWWVTSSWGILAVGAGYTIIHPESREHVLKLAIIFWFALPGQMIANFNQLKILIKIFRKFNITKRTTGTTIYWHERNDKLVNEDLPIDDINSTGGCFTPHLAATRRVSNRYRRDYSRRHS